MSASKMDPIVQATEILRDCIAPVVRRINVDEFTTVEFVDVLQQDEAGRHAYDLAVLRWPQDETLAKMVVHGQIIPELLRMTGLVEWAGFAYDEEDPYAIPAWWRRLSGTGA
ncbi:MAG TPA: hypothetical protein VNE17_03285 [Nitrolancea sp.]|nr:hypothetical protein [Nitrolancea sp.]